MTPWSKKFEKMIVIIDQEWSNHHPFYADVNDELLIETSDTKSKYFTYFKTLIFIPPLTKLGLLKETEFAKNNIG